MRTENLAPIWVGGPDGDNFVAIELRAYRMTLFGQPPLTWHRRGDERGTS